MSPDDPIGVKFPLCSRSRLRSGEPSADDDGSSDHMASVRTRTGPGSVREEQLTRRDVSGQRSLDTTQATVIK